MKRNLILISILILSLSACKKWQKQYPEDTERTKETPMTRLTGKWWKLKNATLNGKDYTDSVYQMFGKYEIYFSSSILSTFNYIDRYSGNVRTDLEPSFRTVWRFDSNEERMFIVDENGNGANGNNSSKTSIIPCYLSSLNNYTYSNEGYLILKLTNTELKISIQTINNDTVVVNNFTSY